MGIFSEYAYQYYGLGMNVIPVNDRKPCAGVTGFNENMYDKRQSEELLEYYVDNYAYANGIAMVCGAHGTVLDVDTVEVHEGLNKLVPRTPMKRFGSKGMGYLYRGALHPKKISRTVVELFGKGYVVLPPSYHPDTGNPYYWHDSQLVNIEDLPELSETQFTTINDYCFTNGLFRQGIAREGNLMGDSCGRNNTLTARIWRMVKDPTSRSKTLNQMVDEIMQFDIDNHEVPWFSDPKERHHRPAREMAKIFVERSIKKASKELASVHFVPSEMWTEPEVHAVVETTPKSKDNSFLIPKGGLIEEVHRLITSLLGYENPVLSFSGALSFCSILGSHKLAVGRAHPNIFMLCTADSGVGKGAPVAAVKKLINSHPQSERLMGCDIYASAQVIAHGLDKQRCRIDIIDECSTLFEGNAKSGGHLRGADAELCKIFTESAGFLPAKFAINKDSKRPAISNPYLTLMMYSTPQAFSRYFSTMLAEEGFGGRMLYLYDDSDPSRLDRGLIGIDNIVSNISTLTKEIMNYWLGMEIKYVDNSGRQCAYIQSGGTPVVRQIQLSERAKEVCRELQRGYMKRLSENKEPGSPDYELRACFLRAMEQMYKVMGCWVVSQSNEAHELDIPEVEWANKVVEYSIESLRGLLDMSSGRSQGQTDINRYRAWAKGKKDIESKYFNQWVRRTLKTSDKRTITNFISILEGEDLGHWEQAENLSANGKVRTKWVFD